MDNIDKFFDDIDIARLRRARELSEIKRSFAELVRTDLSDIASKAVVVLTYANWEGFYNECVQTYIEFLRHKGGRVRDSDWMLLLSALNADFESMRDRNHSLESRLKFVDDLNSKIDCGFELVDAKLIEARSNLDFSRLTQNYRLLSFDLGIWQRWRNRLDKELVGWRHSVAHGESPNLSSLDVNDHIDFTSNMLMLVSDQFQYAMLERV
ncbi:MAE_28990/MAE_18760 family HEPN-like nuclease [Persicitalea jodogahamensis]|uniref:RiboL-PSP-HEPN domain-containing protein n=1 Tax=Persicitalea jodogahamensis TaxID=402147 RepID=A0A8J3D6P5_9BACT|nr:MAE_28990/MAE_18760 family HEPN-like nuclease [Persicitalea jodogahamensis]GHB68480.1 hypothetical protein GCM10007390_22320 [Persicitalea jodogahamensis]